jgi:uncharacterized membrane protein
MKQLVKILREKNRLHILTLFFLTSALCVVLVALRVHYTSKVTFVFLIWNIFLALIPYFISTFLILFHEKIQNRSLLLLPFLAWLCFFPNAPYILTDLFHLKQRSGVPYWFDLALILFFAWNGLMLGYASLMDMQAVFARRFNKLTGWMIAIGSLVLASFGIYLGRYLRWNSWDVVTSPMSLLNDIAEMIMNPTLHPRTYGVTLIFSAFLVLGYLLILQFTRAYRQMGDHPTLLVRQKNDVV